MKPVISIVGRANVGKSTLYNRLTRSRDAIVDNYSGVTRDRMVGDGRLGDQAYWVVDTGGYEQQNASGLQELIQRQFETAVDDSDAIILVVDGRDGLSVLDREIVETLRVGSDIPVFLAVNKAEGVDPDLAVAEFHSLAFGNFLFAISAKQGNGIGTMMNHILSRLAADEDELQPDADVPRIAVVGRPNVGKSTLVNRLLGKDRMIVSDHAGTTRDAVSTFFLAGGRRYALIDTAGVRRKARVVEKIEKFSVVKTLQALEQAHVIVLVVDARQGITVQDASLAGLVRERGRSMVLVVNKWDGLAPQAKNQVRRDLRRELPFLEAVQVMFISAKHGSSVGGVMPAVRKAFESAMADLGTAKLNQVLRRAVEAQPPPRVGQHQIKLKYAHQGGKNPPAVVIHGNLLNKVPESYRRYLANSIGKEFQLTGTRVEVWFRTSENPYQRRVSRVH